MSHISIIDRDTIDWDAHVTHPMQSWEWGEVRRSEGKIVIRFVEYPPSQHSAPSSQLSAVYQMTLHPIPHTGYSIGYIPKSGVPSTDFLTYLKAFATAHKILFVKFEPNVLQTADCKLQIPDSLHESAHPLFTQWNQILDISRSEDELLAAMHHKTRYNIRLAIKKGVTVRTMSDDEGYAIFERLYFETCARQGYRGHTREYHRNVWNNLKTAPSIELQAASLEDQDCKLQIANCLSADEAGRLSSHLLVSWYQGVALGVFQLWRFGDTMYYVYGGSSIEHKSVMAPSLLMWEAIRYAKSLGCTRFDMWGSLPEEHDPSDPWAGFTRFKSGYGTQYVQYIGSYDLVVSPILYRLYSAAQTIRGRML